MLLYNPVGQSIKESGTVFAEDIPNIDIVVPASGTYFLRLRAWSNEIGAYTLLIGCALRDGPVISPGDVVGSTPGLPMDIIGFPGLAPVDMSSAMKLPLIVSTPMTGVVAPTGNEVLGFTLEAQVGGIVELSFRRLSDNLNLGIVVLSPDYRVVFYGGLVLSDSLSTRFTLQDAGQYTIGVYRVDLLSPGAREATAFQVQGTFVP